MDWNKPNVVAIVVNGQAKLVYSTRDIMNLNREMYPERNVNYEHYGLTKLCEDGGKYAQFIDVVEFDTFMKSQDDGFKFLRNESGMKRARYDFESRIDKLENMIVWLTNDLGRVMNKLVEIQFAENRISYKLGIEPETK